MKNQVQLFSEMARAYSTADASARSVLANAMQTLVANAVDSDWRTKFAAAVSGGYDYADTMHNVYLDYGYPQTITFSMFWNMYRRFGIAKNIVELPIAFGWLDTPEIKAPEAFLREFERLEKRTHLWTRIKGLDTRQRVGRYAGLFMRVRDGKKPEEPLEGTLGGEAALVQAVPLYEGQLKVLSTDTNPVSEEFGKPTMYQYYGSGSGDRNENNAVTFNIHPSRLIIAAEGADDGGIYGVPCLEAPYNSLMDLRKIIGGGGEGFYKNAAQSVVFGIKDTAGAKAITSLISSFTEQFDEFQHNRVRKGMVAPGMDPKILTADLANPKEFFDNALNDAAASSQIPATILIGQQTGRLASNEDFKHMATMGNSRRGNFQTQLVTEIVNWLMRHGILQKVEFELEWTDLQAPSDDEKLALAERMAGINEKQYRSGGEVPFDGNEIRETAGYEELSDLPPPDETLPPEDETVGP